MYPSLDTRKQGKKGGDKDLLTNSYLIDRVSRSHVLDTLPYGVVTKPMRHLNNNPLLDDFSKRRDLDWLRGTIACDI